MVGAVSCAPAFVECGVFACDGASWFPRSKYSNLACSLNERLCTFEFTL